MITIDFDYKELEAIRLALILDNETLEESLSQEKNTLKNIQKTLKKVDNAIKLSNPFN